MNGCYNWVPFSREHAVQHRLYFGRGQHSPILRPMSLQCVGLGLNLTDDDDAWAPNHLEACFTAASAAPSAAMVVSGLLRIEGDDADGPSSSPPSAPPPLAPPLSAWLPPAPTQAAATLGPRSPAGAPPIVRPQPLPPAGRLHPSWFFTANPGIQGSNLFVRLGELLRAGLFDEWLPSTTDRSVPFTRSYRSHQVYGGVVSLRAALAGLAVNLRQ
jgi:hypothetical protein